MFLMSPTLTLAIWKVASSLRVTSKETKYGVESSSCEEPKELRKAIPEKIQSEMEVAPKLHTQPKLHTLPPLLTPLTQ